ncbi:MAG TPA: IS1182 family transposase [Candidatus Limnocylindria bacterium]|nr:IS1182 family transposase [Candidatus Limnocylindria bacterium]
MRAERRQMEMRPTDLESLLPEEHKARVVWAWVTRLDLSRFYAQIRSVAGMPGRPAADPAVLLALWLYATLEGVGSAREIDRLTKEHDAYRWIRGGVQLDYHTLSDFRVQHEAALDELLTESVAMMTCKGVADLEYVAQDGMKVRAHAGASSFRRTPRLREYRKQAKAQIAALKRELEEDHGASSRRQKAARERAARERDEKVERALREMQRVKEGKRDEESKREARTSTTDAEARVMRMAGGEFRPAYNAQVASEVKAGLIVGVEVTSSGGDMGQMPPMLDQIERRHRTRPRKMLIDGGYAARDDIEDAASRGCSVYAPPMSRGGDPYTPQPKDGPGVRAWRRRMKSAAARAIYKLRASTSEWVNARLRNWGLRQVLVRGRAKVRCVLLLHALAHNLDRTARLAPALLRG